MVKNNLGEKSVFQCADCKSIMKFPATDLLEGDTYIRLKDDEVYTSNQYAIPYTVLVLEKIPFCPFCNGVLVLLHNRLLDIFHEYQRGQRGKDSALMLSLPSFLDNILDVLESVQRKSVIFGNDKLYVVTQSGKDMFDGPFDSQKEAVEELRVFIEDNYDIKIEEWKGELNG